MPLTHSTILPSMLDSSFLNIFPRRSALSANFSSSITYPQYQQREQLITYHNNHTSQQSQQSHTHITHITHITHTHIYILLAHYTTYAVITVHSCPHKTGLTDRLYDTFDRLFTFKLSIATLDASGEPPYVDPCYIKHE